MEEKQYYSEKRISSSSLKYFEQSPLTFKKFLDQELDQEEKSYLTRGKQIHMAILEPKVFKANYTHLDFETPSSAQQKQFCEDYIKYLKIPFSLEKDPLANILNEDSSLINAYKDNYKTTAKDEKILELANDLKDKLSKYVEYLQKRKQFKDILSNTDWQRIKDLKEGCKIHKKANDLVFNEDLDTRTFLNEFVIFWEHPLYKLPCKSMIDRLIIDHNNKVVTLIDLKTANTFKDFKERCNEFSYFRQMAFYWMAINWYFVNELKLNFDEYTKETYIVALKTVDNPEVKVFKITEQQLKDGWLDLTEQMTLLAWHWENDKWEYTRSYYIGDGDEKL
jgi:hypothetical protein